ncbi:vWA domain-containing protein [Schaalia cardiffensis]|uniref:vWA domain-containing protein n=1 Tax=Schaalia cardiffensis TaxID=181487 RepID=UPI0023F0D0A7|nr:VWA domain-containing protein [Schaalia cardiffensis]
MYDLNGDVEIGTSPSMDAFLFYIVCDTSQSMFHFTAEHRARQSVPSGELLQPAIREMGKALSSNIEIKSQGYLCIISFNDEAKAVQKTCAFENLDLGRAQLTRGTFTDYAKVWRYLGETIYADIEASRANNKKLYRPVVFFITDGIPETKSGRQPHDEWAIEYDRAVSRLAEEFRPRIIALGLDKANENTLKAIHSKNPRHGRALIAKNVKDVNSFIPDLIIAIRNSIANSASGAKFDFVAPPSMTDLCISGGCS